MDIELRLLRSFALMHEAGFISRAAEPTACTQAAISMRLKAIETKPASLPPCAQVWR